MLFCVSECHRRHEPVPPLGQRLHVARAVGAVAQCRANRADAIRKASIEVHVGLTAPHVSGQLIPGDDLTGTRQKQAQDARGLGLEGHQPPGSAQFERHGVELEHPEGVRHVRRLPDHYGPGRV